MVTPTSAERNFFSTTVEYRTRPDSTQPDSSNAVADCRYTPSPYTPSATRPEAPTPVTESTRPVVPVRACHAYGNCREPLTTSSDRSTHTSPDLPSGWAAVTAPYRKRSVDVSDLTATPFTSSGPYWMSPLAPITPTRRPRVVPIPMYVPRWTWMDRTSSPIGNSAAWYPCDSFGVVPEVASCRVNL